MDDEVEQRQPVGEQDQAVERSQLENELGVDLDQQDAEEEGRDDDQPKPDEPPQGLGRRRCDGRGVSPARAIGLDASGHYPIWLMRLNMGRYMATTMVPITTPRKEMMMGSRRDIMPSTAASTSSS